MRRATRDRIKYPDGGGGYCRQPSTDEAIRAQIIVEQILDDLGGLIDAIEDINPQYYSHIRWIQLAVPQTFESKALSPTAIADFVVDKANSISAAFSKAVIRRKRQPQAPPSSFHMPVSLELREYHNVVRGMFRTKSAPQVLEEALGTTESLQHLIDLLERHSSKVVSSYDAMYLDEPSDLTYHGYHDLITTQTSQVSNRVSLSTSTLRPDIDTPSSQRVPWWAPWWDRLGRIFLSP
ncbi:hypothetical protein F5X96DRAFT_661289 [Biscogniauxia mediterranea]|nr:hypothetical protein F5X96DRAFT_661289 [Biscogniauxia mediterranea]